MSGMVKVCPQQYGAVGAAVLLTRVAVQVARPGDDLAGRRVAPSRRPPAVAVKVTPWLHRSGMLMSAGLGPPMSCGGVAPRGRGRWSRGRRAASGGLGGVPGGAGGGGIGGVVAPPSPLGAPGGRRQPGGVAAAASARRPRPCARRARSACPSRCSRACAHLAVEIAGHRPSRCRPAARSGPSRSRPSAVGVVPCHWPAPASPRPGPCPLRLRRRPEASPGTRASPTTTNSAPRSLFMPARPQQALRHPP